MGIQGCVKALHVQSQKRHASGGEAHGLKHAVGKEECPVGERCGQFVGGGDLSVDQKRVQFRHGLKIQRSFQEW